MDFRKLLGMPMIYGPGVGVGVRDMQRAVAWYCDKLGLDHEPKNIEAPAVKIGYPRGEDDLIALVLLIKIPEAQSNAFARKHNVLFTRRLNEVRAKFISKGILVGPMQQDTGGNSFFEFKDCEGNWIEICLEPGVTLDA